MVVLTQPGKWVIGALANNLWSFAGDSDRDNVNLMTVQPFVNYNFGKGWYVSSSPIITANWQRTAATTPGRCRWAAAWPHHPDRQAAAQPRRAGVRNVVKPDDDSTTDWTLRLQVQFLFPK